MRRATLRVLLLGAAALASGGASTTRVYAPQHRAAQQLLPLAEGALGSEGRVVVDPGTNVLALTGEASAVEAALELLESQDRALRSVWVHVRTLRAAGLDAAGYRVAWQEERGRLRLGRLVAGAAASQPSERVRASRRPAGVDAAVRVEEGQLGRIETGRALVLGAHAPFGSPVVAEGVSGLRVRPTLLGDGRVRLELAPEEARLDPGGRTRFTEAELVLTVRSEETVVLGAVARRDELPGARVFSTLPAQQAREDLVLLLWTQVE